MKRYLIAAGVFALVTAAVTVAQDTRPAQPPAGKAAQPGQGKAAPQFPPEPKGATWGTITRVTPAKMANLEEEFELVEAHRDVRKAHVRAAEVAVKAAETQFELINKSGANIAQTELMKAKLEVDAARVQLEIKIAELKEVEVKVKYTKKRLDDAKAAPMVRPGPGVRPVQVDPPPPPIVGEDPALDVTIEARPPADEKLIAALKADIEKRTAEAKKQQEEIALAEKLLKDTEAEAAKATDAEKRKVAEEKAKAFRALLEAQNTKSKALDNEIAKLKAKLKELEK